MLGMFANLFRAAPAEIEGAADDMAARAPRYLPDELVLSIDTAEVFWRPSRADDEDAAPVVRIVGVGMWCFNGIQDAAERVAKAYPDLPPAHCHRAAKLISAHIGRRNREAFERRYQEHRRAQNEDFWAFTRRPSRSERRF